MQLILMATDEDIIKSLQQTMPRVQAGTIDMPNKRKLPRGRVLNGDSREIISKIAKNNNADWSIQDGSLVFLPRDKVLGNEAVLLSIPAELVLVAFIGQRKIVKRKRILSV